jgi:hypothetical protein
VASQGAPLLIKIVEFSILLSIVIVVEANLNRDCLVDVFKGIAFLVDNPGGNPIGIGLGWTILVLDNPGGNPIGIGSWWKILVLENPRGQSWWKILVLDAAMPASLHGYFHWHFIHLHKSPPPVFRLL